MNDNNEGDIGQCRLQKMRIVIMWHRNSQKRFTGDFFVYFVTTVTEKRFPYFNNEVLGELLIEEIRVCKKLKEFELFGFVILPDHVHLLIMPNEKLNISKIMQFLKRHFTRNANDVMNYKNNEGEIGQSRLHKVVLSKFQGEFFRVNSNNRNKPFKWQQSFRDHVIRDHQDFQNHLQYIWYNPVKHGLVIRPEDYYFSSGNINFEGLINELLPL